MSPYRQISLVDAEKSRSRRGPAGLAGSSGRVASRSLMGSPGRVAPPEGQRMSNRVEGKGLDLGHASSSAGVPRPGTSTQAATWRGTPNAATRTTFILASPLRGLSNLGLPRGLSGPGLPRLRAAGIRIY